MNRDKDSLWPCFLDIEASSWHTNSFPIEIAWSTPQGLIECYLINPDSILEWKNWDFSAQSIHGISLDHCQENGIHPGFVCKQLSRSFPPGSVVYADGGPFDQYWIDQLYAVCTKHGFSRFLVRHSDDVILPLLTNVDISKRQEYFDNLKNIARQKARGRHRARVDVEYLIELYKLCKAQAPSH
ncbi:hypothetical protein QZJ86_11235 [Methylomonas montana]|uniref:hypothetical protein n=1 Tax=Methylomonas montana TaxID=3058963 RepID=UPI00265965C5|nr:hypothetical protein [Methylomonas montana]WKJ88599.1 hypothetical protein QZJ86_11235 [Methylomonas montana]